MVYLVLLVQEHLDRLADVGAVGLDLPLELLLHGHRLNSTKKYCSGRARRVSHHLLGLIRQHACAPDPARV